MRRTDETLLRVCGGVGVMNFLCMYISASYTIERVTHL